MKKNLIYVLTALALTITLGACHKKETVNPGDPNTGVVFGNTSAADQVGRPAINTVFVGTADKQTFNTTVPSAMGAAFQSKFQTQLLALNPGYSTNLLGLSASAFTGVLATDVLNVSTTGTTTYYDGTNVLTGRKLSDDVVDISFTLVFGGPSGTLNRNLTSDHVDANDKAFLTVFPYEAQPW